VRWSQSPCWSTASPSARWQWRPAAGGRGRGVAAAAGRIADQAAVALNNARLFAAERAARAEAETAERRVRDLVHGVDAIVTEVEIATRRVLFVNGRVETLMGFPVEQWLTDPGFWRSRVHPDDRERVFAYAEREIAAGRDWAQEYRMRAADGRVVWIRDSVTFRGDRLHCLKVDITERKRTEALLAGEKRVLEMIAAGEALPTVLDALCRTVEAQREGMHCSVLLVEGDRLCHGAAPSLPAGYVAVMDGIVGGARGGPSGLALAQREPMIVEDIGHRRPLARPARAGADAQAARVLVRAGARRGRRHDGRVRHVLPHRPTSDRCRPAADRARGPRRRRGHRSRACRGGAAGQRGALPPAGHETSPRWRGSSTEQAGPSSSAPTSLPSRDTRPRSSIAPAPAHWFGRMHPDDRPLVASSFAALFRGRRALRRRVPAAAQDGRWIWMHDRAVTTYEEHGVAYAYGIYSDITDRKQAEEIRALLLNQVITVQEEERGASRASCTTRPPSRWPRC
jgi:PAS domain S-box-containing protein